MKYFVLPPGKKKNSHNKLIESRLWCTSEVRKHAHYCVQQADLLYAWSYKLALYMGLVRQLVTVDI